MLKVLIVDDHAVVRRGLRGILEEELSNASCGEARDAEQALQFLWHEPWDVVVLDITMPGRSGLELLSDVKHNWPDLPVLVLSMHPEDQYALRVLKAGASGYMTKESAPEELVQAIRKVLKGGKYVSSWLAEKLALNLQNHGQELPHELLSNREYEVLCQIASGRAVSQIGRDLHLSVKTISTYRRRILQKMDLANNAELTAYAVRHKLVF